MSEKEDDKQSAYLRLAQELASREQLAKRYPSEIGGVGALDVQTFRGSGTWKKPSDGARTLVPLDELKSGRGAAVGGGIGGANNSNFKESVTFGCGGGAGRSTKQLFSLDELRQRESHAVTMKSFQWAKSLLPAMQVMVGGHEWSQDERLAVNLTERYALQLTKWPNCVDIGARHPLVEGRVQIWFCPVYGKDAPICLMWKTKLNGKQYGQIIQLAATCSADISYDVVHEGLRQAFESIARTIEAVDFEEPEPEGLIDCPALGNAIAKMHKGNGG